MASFLMGKVVGFCVHQILEFVCGDDFLCYALSGVIL
jgi:hypothetical protein